MSDADPKEGVVQAGPAPEEDRRDPSVPDRRKKKRGGRRATDVMRDVADFVYRLLSEPP